MNAPLKIPEFVKIQFRPTAELFELHDPVCSIHTDIDVKINPELIYLISRQDAMRLIVSWPNNIRIIKNINDDKLLVSAVMPTCAGRENFARRQIKEFEKQTYPDKELIIVNQGHEWLTTGNWPGITEVRVKPELLNGALHNIGDSLAQGKYIIRWDDDDIIAYSRIEKMIIAVKESDAVAATYANYINYSLLDGTIREQHAGFCPGLLMYRNDGFRYKENMIRGSDGLFCMKNYYGQIAVIDNLPHEYIRILHGTNQIWDREAIFPNTAPGEIEVSDLTDVDYIHDAIKKFKAEIGSDEKN